MAKIEEELIEILNELKEIEKNLSQNVKKIIYPRNEVYKQIIGVSRKYPELKELIEFIIFLSDSQYTNNEMLKDILKENFENILDLKIKSLNLILKMNDRYKNKILTKEEEKEVKEEEKEVKEEEKEVKEEVKNSIDNLSFLKKVGYYLTIVFPGKIFEIIKIFANSKVGIAALSLFILILFIHFFPKESFFVIDKIKEIKKW